MSRERFTENPFYVLGLRPDCSRADLEREGQKLLAMLELGMESAKSYPTPLGPAQRTADAVRQAMAELRDPQRRLMHELWAQLPASPSPTESPNPALAAAPAQGESATNPEAVPSARPAHRHHGRELAPRLALERAVERWPGRPPGLAVLLSRGAQPQPPTEPRRNERYRRPGPGSGDLAERRDPDGPVGGAAAPRRFFRRCRSCSAGG